MVLEEPGGDARGASCARAGTAGQPLLTPLPRDSPLAAAEKM